MYTEHVKTLQRIYKQCPVINIVQRPRVKTTIKQRPRSSGSRRCDACGHPVSATAKFCTGCGKPLAGVAPAVAPQKLKQRLKTKTKLAAPRVKKQKLKTKPPRLRRPKPKTAVTVPQKQVSKTVSTVAPQVSKTVSKTSQTQKQVVEAIQGWFYCGSCYRKGPHGVDRCVHCGVKFVFCRHGDGGKYRPKQCIAYYGSVGSS